MGGYQIEPVGTTQLFSIISKLNGFAVTLSALPGQGLYPGTIVHMSYRTGADNQLWYEDQVTGSMRPKLNPTFCLDVTADLAVVNPYEPGKKQQQWRRNGDKLCKPFNVNRVMDIRGANRGEHASLIVYNMKPGAPNQQWTYEFAPCGTPERCTVRYFFIWSHMNGKALTVHKNQATPGATVNMWQRKTPPANADNQLWYLDEQGVLRSKLNGFSLDSSSGSLLLQPHTPGHPNQQWTIQEARIVNRTRPQQALDIRGADGSDGANVIEYAYKGSANQHWGFEFFG